MGISTDGSEMIARHIQALSELEGKKVEAGWFESDRYPDGKSVAAIARQNEFGTVINIPEGEKTINRMMNEKTGKLGKNGRFVKSSKATFQSSHHHDAYAITIPPRPFMRLAFANFMKESSAIQKRLAKKLFAGEISPDQILGQIGLSMEGHIVKSIKNGSWTPNAASTIAKKGFDKPLIETSHMWQNVSSKIVSGD